MRVKVTLVVLMGLPASGKTTLCSEIFQAFSAHDDTLIVRMVYDNFVSIEEQSQFINNSNCNLAKVVRQNYLQCIYYVVNKYLESNDSDNLSLEAMLSPEADSFIPKKIFIEKVEKLAPDLLECHRSVLVLIDDNNYYHSMRNEYYQIAKKYSLGFCILHCNSPIEVCKRRNIDRPEAARVPTEVITEMNSKFEEPNPMKNACDVYCFQIPDEGNNLVTPSTSTVTPFQDTLPLILAVLKNSVKNPVCVETPVDRTEDIAKERKICSENAVHQADLMLRKWINTEITMLSLCTKNRKDIRNLCTELNRRKSIVIDGLKSGEITLLSEVEQDVEFRKEVIALARNVQL